ncbi:hypothetical protein PBR20603_03369 [Pandoraea bronchicola]|uniref:Uncharacterized protein n=1 Tax=Pandoraea bronchicola TaxID=2508287 RepID=A0A5E5BYI7_9BURK|nr:hypothetical protein PBR20603_03369 [Pandoraea bronchicola]
MTSASNVVMLAPTPLVTVRVRPPVLSRMARPVPVMLIVPLFTSVALPVMATPTVLPATESRPPLWIVPDCPLDKVCPALLVRPLVMIKLAAKACCSAKSAMTPARMASGFIYPDVLCGTCSKVRSIRHPNDMNVNSQSSVHFFAFVRARVSFTPPARSRDGLKFP